MQLYLTIVAGERGFTQYRISAPHPFIFTPLSPPVAAALGPLAFSVTVLGPLAYSSSSARPLTSWPNLTCNKGDGVQKWREGGGPNIQYCDWANILPNLTNNQEQEPLETKNQEPEPLGKKNSSRSQSCLGKRNFRFLTGQIFNQYGTLSRHYALCIGADEIYPYLLLFLLLFSALIVNTRFY